MKTQIMKSAMLALVVLVPMLGSTNAMAVDGKIYTPLGCVKSGTSGVLTYDRADSISNTSTTQSLTVNCPLVRDSTASGISSGWVTIVDRSTASAVSCTLKNSVYADNSPTPSTNNGANVLSPIGLNSNATVRLSFSGSGIPTGISNGVSQYYYTCNLPRAESTASFSSLRSYSLTEND